MKTTQSPLSGEEKERAALLHASGKTGNAIGKALGRNRRTVQKFLDKPETRAQVGIQREELALLFDDIAQRTLDGVTAADIEKASLLQKLTSAGISVDKALLLRGQGTSAIDVHVLLDIAAIVRGDTLNQSSLPNHPQSPPLLSPPGNQK
jgi:hypothetical protein